MPLNDFHGEWNVGSSGRQIFPKGNYYIHVSGNAWTLKTLSGEFGTQTEKGYDGIRNMIHCTLKIGETEYYFEAVLGKNKCNTKSVMYGHLFPKACAEEKDPFGEGATGGWSSERQGDPPPPW